MDKKIKDDWVAHAAEIFIRMRNAGGVSHAHDDEDGKPVIRLSFEDSRKHSLDELSDIIAQAREAQDALRAYVSELERGQAE